MIDLWLQPRWPISRTKRQERTTNLLSHSNSKTCKSWSVRETPSPNFGAQRSTFSKALAEDSTAGGYISLLFLDYDWHFIAVGSSHGPFWCRKDHFQYVSLHLWHLRMFRRLIIDLVNVLLGTVQATAGTLHVNGRSIRESNIRTAIGYVPQEDIMIREFATVKEIFTHSAVSRYFGCRISHFRGLILV